MNTTLVTIEYKTADGSRIKVEVSASVKEVLEETDRKLRSQGRQDRRHIDFMPLSDEVLEISLSTATEDTAEIYEQIERNARPYEAISQLTDTSKRRLCLYYFCGLKHREIAELEGVHPSAVGYSLKLALKKLYKLLAD